LKGANRVGELKLKRGGRGLIKDLNNKGDPDRREKAPTGIQKKGGGEKKAVKVG